MRGIETAKFRPYMSKREIAAISLPMGADYLKTAFLFAERAQLVEASPPPDAFEWSTLHRSYVTSSLLSATCALEATINEWFSFPEEIDAKPSPATGLRVQRMWSLGIPRTASFQVLQKYQVALALTGRAAFVEGEEPYQSARLLIELRNWLVHYEPTWEPVAAHEEAGEFSPHKLMRRLRGRFKPNPLCQPDAPFWPLKCLGAGCSLWAAEAALAFMDAFFERCDPKSSSRPDKRWIQKVRELGRSPGSS
jgi:hypothetical protein